MLHLIFLSFLLLSMPSPGKSALTSEQRNALLNLHNQYRRAEGAADMLIMKWNSNLEQKAQQWANNCTLLHSNSGQNIAYWSDIKTPATDGVTAWYDEKSYAQPKDGYCSDIYKCGHYTQVVWAKSAELGCGLKQCSSGYAGPGMYLVCNYLPVGNYVGQKTYITGSACTKCQSGSFWCNQGLCDGTCSSTNPKCQCAATCKNGGTKTSTCGCKCTSDWAGVDCSEQCKDNHVYCDPDPGVPGWPPYWCDVDYVRQYCLKMCGLCGK